MTKFRPTSLSPEALEAWDAAEANIEASMQRIKKLIEPVYHRKRSSLKQQAIEIMYKMPAKNISKEDFFVLLSALEALPND